MRPGVNSAPGTKHCKALRIIFESKSLMEAANIAGKTFFIIHVARPSNVSGTSDTLVILILHSPLQMVKYPFSTMAAQPPSSQCALMRSLFSSVLNKAMLQSRSSLIA